jgi:ABC-type polysaccharide/polyol phosphate transport system ATPase subunit
VFVSHSPDAVRAVCDRVCVLNDGRLQFDGGVADGLAFYDRLRAMPAPAVRGT